MELAWTKAGKLQVQQVVRGKICYQTAFGSSGPLHSKANQRTPGCGKESTAFIAGCPSKENGQLMLKKPEILDGFQDSVFKDSVRERFSGCVISSHTILWLVDGEVTR